MMLSRTLARRCTDEQHQSGLTGFPQSNACHSSVYLFVVLGDRLSRIPALGVAYLDHRLCTCSRNLAFSVSHVPSLLLRRNNNRPSSGRHSLAFRAQGILPKRVEGAVRHILDVDEARMASSDLKGAKDCTTIVHLEFYFPPGTPVICPLKPLSSLWAGSIHM